jgi:hypothetical protein
MDNDGIVNKEDIRIVLSYITLDDSPDIKSSGINITYSKRIKSQEELYIILQKCFENIPNNKMNFQTFKNVIENVNSDIYLMIYIFLLENKPFTKENIKSYQNKKTKGKDSTKNFAISEKNLIMSPSKNSNFSPYKVGLRSKGRRTTVVNKEIDFSKILQSTNTNLKKSNLQNVGTKKEGNEYKRKGNKKRTVQYESNIIKLKDIKDDEEKKNKIKEGRVKDLTRKRKENKEVPEEQIQIKPAFKQKIKKNKEKSNSRAKNKKKNKEEEETSLSFENESDGSSEIDDEEEEEDDEDDILRYEGTLYKLVDGKMR